MPRVFTMRTPIWQADLDAFGEWRTSALLRFLQETATAASADAGFDGRYYDQSGTMWLVRRTTLNLLEPARYGDAIEAVTWIADFRRVRSRRDYEVRAGDRMIARAHTDWVYVDRERSRPRRVPVDMERVFVPDGAHALERPDFPEADPPTSAFRSERRVELHELDALRHVNNANYVHYLEQACYDAAAAAGWTLTEQLAAGGRLRAVAHDLEYLDSAIYGDRLSVVTWPLMVSIDAVERQTWVVRNGSARPLLQGISRYAWVDLVDGAPCAIPDAFRTALAPPGAG